MKVFIVRNKAGLIVLAVGCVMLVIGIWEQEPFIVMKKAALICLECIGIG